MNEEIDSGLVLTRLGLAAFAFLVALPVLFWFCWLREMVLDTYYPIFFINLVLMFAYVVLLLRVPPRTPRVLRLNLAVLSVMAAGIIFAGICTVADNVLLLLS